VAAALAYDVPIRSCGDEEDGPLPAEVMAPPRSLGRARLLVAPDRTIGWTDVACDHCRTAAAAAAILPGADVPRGPWRLAGWGDPCTSGLCRCLGRALPLADDRVYSLLPTASRCCSALCLLSLAWTLFSRSFLLNAGSPRVYRSARQSSSDMPCAEPARRCPTPAGKSDRRPARARPAPPRPFSCAVSSCRTASCRLRPDPTR